MQQRINSFDTVGLGELVTVGQVSHDSGRCLYLYVVCQPVAQFDEDVEGGEVCFAWGRFIADLSLSARLRPQHRPPDGRVAGYRPGPRPL